MSGYDDLTYVVYAADDIEEAMGKENLYNWPLVFGGLDRSEMEELVKIMRKHGKGVEVRVRLDNEDEEATEE